jgi:murein L,D-transpeptidase YafK
MLSPYFSFKVFLSIFFSICIGLMSACTIEKPKKKLVIKPLINEEAVIKDDKPIKEDIENTSAVWLLIDTKKKRLDVKRGKKILASFDKIAIGRRGAGFKNKRGDKITPLGTYKIGWINNKSSFRTFYGFTYPSIENAKEALKKGLISRVVYYSILDAHHSNKIPPQNTSLGGRIGLHGLGSGNVQVHRLWDWTKGCVAVTNQQIDALSRWIVKGMTVKVK